MIRQRIAFHFSYYLLTVSYIIAVLVEGHGKSSSNNANGDVGSRLRRRRQRRRLQRAVDFPDPCRDLPENPTDNGWTLALEPTDEGSSDEIMLNDGFTFPFYGQNFTSLYINNDGYLYFDEDFRTFFGAPLPNSLGAMVAPFFGDVDTRSRGYVYYQPVGSNTFSVAWDQVGHWFQNSERLNTFQVLISDGTNEEMGLGNTVCFCYEEMQWTSADSNGQNGFGGDPATVGANGGDGSSYFQIGLFDSPGTFYDGPDGENDGVNFLDIKSICANTNSLNTPPIAVNFPAGNKVELDCGDTFEQTLLFYTPERGQAIHIATSVSPDNPAGFLIDTAVNGYEAIATILYNPTGAPQVATVDFTLTDSAGGISLFSLELDYFCDKIVLPPVKFPNPCRDLPPDPTSNGWTLALGPSDDASNGPIPLNEFTFSLFGDLYNSLYINNNGNLSFDGPSSSFTAVGFPNDRSAMVAPFWADVDTRNTGSVYYQSVGSNAFAVAWDDAGHWFRNDERTNTFQVIISDGTNEEMGEGNNICFCYTDMQWTTGDDIFTGTGNGFGLPPATVGANRGDGISYFQFGSFDAPGTFYDGPHGENDGVDFLDIKSFCANAGQQNTYPIAVNFPPDNKVQLGCHETFEHTLLFYTPEQGQTITLTATVTPEHPRGFSMDLAENGYEAVATIRYKPFGPPQKVTVDFTATDSAGATSHFTLELDYYCDGFCWGDPHFKTLSGEAYDFMGECDLIFAKNDKFADGLGLHVHVRSVMQDGWSFTSAAEWSFISAAAIKIGEDVFEVESFGKYRLNNVPHAELPGTLSGYRVVDTNHDVKHRRFKVDLGDKGELAIKCYGAFISVKVHLEDGEDYEDLFGLLGNGWGKTVSRDGKTVMTDMDEFGNEWQVSDNDPKLFHEKKGPQYPQKCRMPSETGVSDRRLKANPARIAEAETACKDWPTQMKESCVYDVLSSGDLETAQIGPF